MENNSIQVDSFETTCRTCMSISLQLKPLDSNTVDQNITLRDSLYFVTNIRVSDDCLPKQICNACEMSLTMCHRFKRRCMKSESVLHALLAKATESTFSEAEVKNEATVSPFQCSSCYIQFTDVLELRNHVMLLHDLKEDIKKIEFDKTKEMPKECVFASERSTNYVKKEPFDNHDCKDDNSSDNDFGSESIEVFEIKSNDTISENITKPKQKVKKKVNKDVIHKCEICNLKYNTRKSYRRHVRTKHEANMPKEVNFKYDESSSTSEDKIYQCSKCLRKFLKKKTLIAHLKRHNDTNFVCSLCKREFKHKAHLENHILSIHTMENGLICDVCNKSFANQESLDLHKTSHDDKKKHQCKLCPKAFQMPSSLKDHMRVHTGEKPYLCPTCGKGFSQNANLLEHVRRHQGIKPFKCDSCDRRFISKGELSAHTRKHSGAHPFICVECGSGFTTSSSLRKHQRLHTGERPYACDLCPLKFAASGTLKNHRRTHTGEKPYKCQHCEKAFVQKNDLVSHIRCHTGERPFVCSTCGQGFRQSSALKTHQKLHQIKPDLYGRKDGQGIELGTPSLSTRFLGQKTSM